MWNTEIILLLFSDGKFNVFFIFAIRMVGNFDNEKRPARNFNTSERTKMRIGHDRQTLGKFTTTKGKGNEKETRSKKHDAKVMLAGTAWK